MPQNSNFRLPRGHRSWPKLDLTVMAPNHGGDPLGSILGPMRSHWVPKFGQNRKKITMPQNSNFRLPWGHRFRPKLDFTVIASNYGGDPLGSILGPMGSHWGQKMGQNSKKLPCHKIRIFDYPQSSISSKIGPDGYGAKSQWGPPRVHLGANGVPLGPKHGSKP